MDEYEVWAMEMEYWITNNDMNIWKVIQNGNSLKRTGRDHDGRVIILPITTADERIAVQRESKVRTTLLQSIPDDHHEFLEFRIGEAEGLHKRYDRMQKILSQLNQLKAKPEDEDINLKFLRVLPSSWSRVALTLKTKSGLELLSFDDLYYKLKTLEVDVKGYTTFSSNQSTGPSHSAFVSATSASKKMSYGDSRSYSSTTTYTTPSNSNTGSHRSDFKQIEKLDLEEMDLKWQMAMLSVRVQKFEQKAGRKIDFDKKESARFNKKKVRCYKCQQRGHFARECRFGMIAGCDTKDEIKEGAAKIYNLITGADTEEASTVGFNNYIRENELGRDDSAFSVFTTNSEDVEGRPLFNRFAKTDSMTAVPPPLSEDYTSLSDHINLDESQMSYGTKSSTSSDSMFVSNDFVSYDDSDKSSEVSTNDFASSDSSVKSSEPKPNNSTFCASTSSVSTSENEAEIESNVGKPIQEPIIVQDLPSFSCNSFDKNENTSRTSCNKNGYFNKKSGHFRKNASSVSKTSKVNIPPARPQPVPTGKPKVFAPVPTGSQNRPFLVPTDRGYSPSVISGWWKSTARATSNFSRPTSSYFQTYTSYVPIMYSNHIKYGGDKWATAVKPLADAENEGVFDSGVSRSMTGNKERLDNFQEFQGGKVMFGGGEDTECLVLSKDFKLPDESMVVLRVPRKHNLYTINLNNLCPRGNLACLVASESGDGSVKRHRRMGHVNYKNMNRLVKGNLVREHKDETYPILKDFINLVENQLNKKVKAIRCDSGTEFKNALIIELCGSKGIKREYSNGRTPQQNRVAERKNKTLIEAARTMLVDSKLPTMFWTEAVRTACYVLNRVLVTSLYNKTPYALLTRKIPSVSHFKPFGCHVTILNIIDHLGKFDRKADEGYIVGYSASNKAYKVYNVPNKRVEETMNLRYLEEKPNVRGLGHEWYFNLDYLTDTLSYQHDKANPSAGTQDALTNPAGTQDADSYSDCDEQVIIVHSYPSHNIQGTEPKHTSGDEVNDSPLNFANEIFQKEPARLKGQEQRATSDAESLGLGISVPTGSILVYAGDTMVSTDDVLVHTSSLTDSFFDDEPTTRFSNPSDLGNHDPSHGIFSSSSYDDEFSVALNNVASTMEVNPVATTRINTIHPQCLIIGDPTSAVQTRSNVKQTTTVEPSSVAQALEDLIWVDAIQEEMQQFKFQNVWFLVDLPEGKYAIKTKWILKNKKDARGIVVRNKARLVAQGHRQEDGIDYDEVFAPVARIKAIRLFLAFASYMRFMVYQTDVKSVFLYEELMMRYMSLNLRVLWILNILRRSTRLLKLYMDFINHQELVYVDDIIFGSTKKVWCDEFEALMKGEFQMSAMGELTFFLGLQVQQRPDGIFINQDKYVYEILNKFDLGSVRTTTTPYAAPKPKSKNESDIKKIFKYLKGQPKLGLWYPRESPLVLEAYSHSDYAGANKDKKSTTGECQFLGQSLMVQEGGFMFFKCSTWTRWPYFDDKAFILSTATLKSPELCPPAIQATIDKTPYTITEDLVRSQLQLADDGGIDDFPIAEIYSRMDNISPLIVALICLSDGRQFKWSSYIFKGMVSNIGNAKNFLMYPRFLQIILGIETRIKIQYKVLMFSSKLFANMRLNFEGHPMPLLPAMLSQAQEDPNLASFSRTHETAADPFTIVEDEPLGGSFHMSPPRSTLAPFAGQTSGGAEDLITLTALSSVVFTLVDRLLYGWGERQAIIQWLKRLGKTCEELGRVGGKIW
nr:hypothetical protein [Tanacetum cinerariifolium]